MANKFSIHKPLVGSWSNTEATEQTILQVLLYLVSQPQILCSTKIPLFQKSKDVFKIICAVQKLNPWDAPVMEVENTII